MPNADHAAADTAIQMPAPSSDSIWKSPISGRGLTGLAAVLLIGAGVVFGLRQLKSWREAAARNAIARHDEPPADWKEIRLGMSRAEVAGLLVESGVRWSSIQKPGTAPTPWAAQTNLNVKGHPAREFSVKFSDGQRWDYGQHTQAPDEVVDVDNLIGGLSADSELDGLMWMIERSEYDLGKETVPIEVLKELGTAHTDQKDITGTGRVYIWNWPMLKAYYTTIDGRLALQQSKKDGGEVDPQ